MTDVPSKKKAEFYRTALFENPKDTDALRGLALALAREGQYASAVFWCRRAMVRLPESRSLRKALSDALLRREHWQEGRRLQDTPEEKPLQGVSSWKGKQPGAGYLLVYQRKDDPCELAIIGLAVLSRLQDKGVNLVFLSHPDLDDVIANRLPHVKIVNETQAHTMHDNGEIAAQSALADLAFQEQSTPAQLSHWLSKTGKPDTGSIGVTQNGKEEGAIFDKTFLSVLKETSPALIHPVDMTLGLAAATNTMEKVDALVTDDGCAALIAASMGRNVTLFLPPEAPWWWGDRERGTHWSPGIRVIKVSPKVSTKKIVGAINDILSEGMKPVPPRLPIRPESGEQEVAELLDRVSPLLREGKSNTLKITPLQGGTRNKVFQVSYPGEDKILRMGRFPPRKAGSRGKEIGNMVIASKADIAPKVFFGDPVDGTMLSQFIKGVALTSKLMRKERNAINVGRLFRRLHTLTGFQGNYDIFSNLEWNMKRLERKKAGLFLEKESDRELVEMIRKILRRNRMPPCPTHNDPFTHNFIAVKNGMILIDWECSGVGDPHWEVGGLCSQVGLNEDLRAAYLKEYFGKENHPASCRIPLYEFVCRYYWWTESIMTGIDDPDDKTWRDDVNDWQHWLRETHDKKYFKTALKDAEAYRWQPEHALPADE